MPLENIDLLKLSRIATILAQWAKIGNCLALYGNLGAGKSTFSRYFLQALNPAIVDVPSPTFTLIQSYDTSQGEVWHCDLYRLKHPEEVLELGLEDAFPHIISLLEWPEKLDYFLPKDRLEIYFEINPDESRTIRIISVGRTDAHLQSYLDRLQDI